MSRELLSNYICKSMRFQNCLLVELPMENYTTHNPKLHQLGKLALLCKQKSHKKNCTTIKHHEWSESLTIVRVLYLKSMTYGQFYRFGHTCE